MLYTGKGDKGDTYFFDSEERSPKSSLRAEALGSLDEVNSLIGYCRAKASFKKKKKRGRKKQPGISVPEVLEQIQQDLFIIQANLAGASKDVTKEKVRNLENIINSIERELPPIKSFFLPGSTELGGLLDVTRAVVRRAERVIVRYSGEYQLSPETLSYMNRLSSLLYALVRFVNLKSGARETPPTYK